MLSMGEPPGDVKHLRVAFSPTLGYARVEAEVASAVSRRVGKLQSVFQSVDLVEQVCEDEGEILAAEFIGGCSARLGDVVDNAPISSTRRCIRPSSASAP